MHSALTCLLWLNCICYIKYCMLCLILGSQPQLAASTRTNLKRGTVPIEVRLGSCSLRQRNRNNQKFDISEEKQRRMRPGLGRRTSKVEFKKMVLMVWEVIGKSTHRDFSITTWFTACGSSEQCLLQGVRLHFWGWKGMVYIFCSNIVIYLPFLLSGKGLCYYLRENVRLLFSLISSWGRCWKETIKGNGCWDTCWVRKTSEKKCQWVRIPWRKRVRRVQSGDRTQESQHGLGWKGP